MTRSGRRLLDAGEGRGPVGDGVDLVTLLTEQARHVVAHVRIVVGQQDTRTAERRRGSGRGGPLRRRERRRLARAHAARAGEPAQRLLDEGGGAERGSSRVSPLSDPLLRKVRRPRGNLRAESAPRAHLALHRYLAAVQLHQLPHQCQADSRSLVGAALRSTHAVEAFEDVRELLRRDPRARVPDRQLHRALHRPQRNGDLPFEGELEGVREEVEDDLLPHLPVDVHRLRERRGVHHQPQPRPLDGRAEGARQLHGVGGEVRRLVGGLRAAGLDPREVEERVDQSQQAKRIAVDHLELVAHAGRDLSPFPVPQVLQRPEHERERSAKLVADVAEERGLRPVERRQRLGALPLLLVRFGVAEAAGDLARDHAEEAQVVGIGESEGAEADDQEAGAAGLARGGDREHGRAGGRAVPGARGEVAEGAVELHHLPFVEVRRLGQRPGRGPVEREREGGGRVPAPDPRRPGEGGGPLLLRVEEVEEGEGEVARVGGERGRAPLARVFHRPRVGRPGGQLAEQGHLPLADDAHRVVRVGADDPAGASLVVGDGAVGKGVVGLLLIPVALHDQELRLDVRPLVSGHGGPQHGPDHVPDLAPYDGGGLPQGLRVLPSDDALIGVVVEVGELRSPADPDGLAGGQHDAHAGLQALRPAVGGAEGSGRPVEGAHPRPHLAAAGKEIVHHGYAEMEGGGSGRAPPRAPPPRREARPAPRRRSRVRPELSSGETRGTPLELHGSRAVPNLRGRRAGPPRSVPSRRVASRRRMRNGVSGGRAGRAPPTAGTAAGRNPAAVLPLRKGNPAFPSR